MPRTTILSLIPALLVLPAVTACDVEKDEQITAAEPEDEIAEKDEEEEPPAEEPPAEEPPAEEPPAEEPPDLPLPSEGPDPAEACAGEVSRPCALEGGEEGVDVCVLVDGAPTWSGCLSYEDVECMPGDDYDNGCIGSYCTYDGERFTSYGWQTDPECDTPLVLDFAGDLRFDAATGGASFDFAAASSGCQTDWPSAPWLALDRDRSGSVDSGRELFGSGTLLASGRRAAHGFEALAELDADGDRKLTAADPRFAELVLWSDHDGDREGPLAELALVADLGLVAIHLDYDRRGVCDARGNCGLERASFEYRAATGEHRIGEVVDVYLACQ